MSKISGHVQDLVKERRPFSKLDDTRYNKPGRSRYERRKIRSVMRTSEWGEESSE